MSFNTRKPKDEKEQAILDRCYKAGMKNGWASGRYAMEDGDFITEEDRLNFDSISFIDSREDLKRFFEEGNWMLGQGIIYKNLFFLNQIDGGDEWATYKITDKEIFQFESISFLYVIRDNEFESDMDRMEKATDEQLKNLEY